MKENLHVFCFNPKENGGQSIHLVTTINSNNISQSLELNCFGNCSSLQFGDGIFTPDILRKLADELEI